MDFKGNQQVHEYFAKECFDQCWQYIDLNDRSEFEDNHMIRLSETSFWHTSRIKKAPDDSLSAGLWQLSRVYALTGNFEKAYEYGHQCLMITQNASLAPFFMAYAHEAIARAQKTGSQSFDSHLSKAYAYTDKVEEEKEKRELLTSLKQIGERPS